MLEINKSFLNQLGISDLLERSRIWKSLHDAKGLLHSGKIMGISKFESMIMSFSLDKSIRFWTFENGEPNSNNFVFQVA